MLFQVSAIAILMAFYGVYISKIVLQKDESEIRGNRILLR